MKKLLLSALFLFISFFAIAGQHGWYLSGGLNVGGIQQTFTCSENIAIGYMWNQHWGIFGGIGWQTDFYADGSRGEPRSRMARVNYLQVPVFIRFTSSLNARRLEFYSDMGAKTNFKRSEYRENGFSYDLDSYNVGMMAFVNPGIKFLFGKKVSLNLGPEISYGSMGPGASLKSSLNVYLGQ